MNYTHKSNAQWPTGTIGDGLDHSTDRHSSYEEAASVCNLLEEEGFGCEREIFPIRTWVSEILP